MEGCCEKIVKYFLFAFSFLFALVGLGIIGFGIYILIETNYYMEFLTNDYLNTIYFLISLGIIICFISLVGFIGSFQRSRCLISSFTTILILILIAEFFGGFASCIIKDSLQKSVRLNMEDAMAEYKVGDNNSSGTWDSVQSNFHCCGISGRDDWGGVADLQGTVPTSCCKTNVTSPDCGNDVNNTYDTGCLHTFVEQFFPVINIIPSNTLPDISIVTGLAVAVACIQLLGLLFGCCYGMCLSDRTGNKCQI